MHFFIICTHLMHFFIISNFRFYILHFFIISNFLHYFLLISTLAFCIFLSFLHLHFAFFVLLISTAFFLSFLHLMHFLSFLVDVVSTLFDSLCIFSCTFYHFSCSTHFFVIFLLWPPSQACKSKPSHSFRPTRQL